MPLTSPVESPSLSNVRRNSLRFRRLTSSKMLKFATKDYYRGQRSPKSHTKSGRTTLDRYTTSRRHTAQFSVVPLWFRWFSRRWRRRSGNIRSRWQRCRQCQCEQNPQRSSRLRANSQRLSRTSLCTESTLQINGIRLAGPPLSHSPTWGFDC